MSLVDLKDKQVVDLCGGSSDLCTRALQRGAKIVTVVDQSKAMLGWLPTDLRISAFCGSVESFLSQANDGEFDCVFCRQAVNYWLDLKTSRLLAQKIRRGGFFVFNTFNERPSNNPTVKEYEFEGHRFVEISQLCGEDMVHHVQCRDGMEPHTTCFKWITPGKFKSLLRSYFSLQIRAINKTSLYVCERK